MGKLDGRVAVVTGAGRGIGAAEAKLLASEGASVVVNDVNEENAKGVVDEIVGAGGKGSVHVGDASEWDEGEGLVNQTIDEFGHLDIVVNNAGILRDAMSFNMTEDDWDSVIKVHLKGHFTTARFAGAYWRERAKAGEEVNARIINTASEAGLFGNLGQLNYGAAKAGIAAMAIVLARELGKYGVTANAIAPRARTAMTENLFPEMSETAEGFDPFAPENVAPLVTWLATDEAADVNGQVFVVYGGLVQVMEGWRPVSKISKDSEGWTVDELVDRKSELFGDRGSGVPDFAF